MEEITKQDAPRPPTKRTAHFATKRRLALRHGEMSKISFWISQVFMLMATVLGVFLAGQQGLKQAVVFEQIQSDKNNYYLRKSLQHELTDNLDLIREYSSGDRISLELETFVWEAMKYSSATLETPSVLLSESRQFHRQVNEIYERIQTRYYQREYGRKLLEDVVDHMENTVLPLFEADTLALKDTLIKKKVSL